jgi:hypothetical protein
MSRFPPVYYGNYKKAEVFPDDLLASAAILRKVYLKRNLLCSIPNDLGSFSNVTELYLASNRLSALPNTIAMMTSLEELDVSDNSLVEVPPEIGKLVRLRKLWLSDNLLKRLPDSIGQLVSLVSLHVMRNVLVSVPKSLVQCKNLNQIFLDHNHLSCIPRNLVFLEHLSELSVGGNKFLYAPFIPFVSQVIISGCCSIDVTPIQFALSNHIDSAGNVVWTRRRHQQASNNITISEMVSLLPKLFIPASHQDGASFGDRLEDFFRGRASVSVSLDDDLQFLHSSFHLPSLKELCLRHVYARWSCHGYAAALDSATRFLRMEPVATKAETLPLLPVALANLLFRDGPVAFCRFAECRTPVFTSANLTIVMCDKNVVSESSGDDDLRETAVGPFVVLFCSKACEEAYFSSIPNTSIAERHFKRLYWRGNEREH